MNGTLRPHAIARAMLGAPPTPSGERALAILAVVAWAIAAILDGRGPPEFPLDDAYITQHGAAVLFHGADPRFPQAHALHGSTSVLHVLVVALMGAVVRVERAQWMVGWIAILAYVLGLSRLGRALARPMLERVGLVLAGLLALAVPYHLRNGLETTAVLAAETWAIALLCESSVRSRRALAILAGSLPLLRPELWLLAPVLLAVSQWTHRARAGGGPRLRDRLLDLLAFPVVAGAGTLWIWEATGAPLPSSLAAKAAWYAQSCLAVGAKLDIAAHGLRGLLVGLGPLAIGVVGLGADVRGRGLLAFAVVFLVAYLLRFPDGLRMQELRYAHALVPLLVYGIAFGLAARARAARWGARLTLAAVVIYGAVRLPATLARYSGGLDFSRTELADVARFVREELPKDARVLVHDVGYLSQHSEATLVDLVGLKTPASVARHEKWTLATCGRMRHRALAIIAVRERATHLVILAEWNVGGYVTDWLQRYGIGLVPLRDGGPAGYSVFRLILPPE